MEPLSFVCFVKKIVPPERKAAGRDKLKRCCGTTQSSLKVDPQLSTMPSWWTTTGRCLGSFEGWAQLVAGSGEAEKWKGNILKFTYIYRKGPLLQKGEDVILWKGKTCWVVTNMQNFKIIDIYELKPRVWCKFLKAVWIRSHYRSHQFPGLLWWVDPTSTRHTCLRWMKLRLALMRWIVHRTCNNNLGAFLSYSNRWYEMLSCDPLNGHIDIYR